MKYTPRRVVDKALELMFNGLIAIGPNRVFGRIRPHFLRVMGAQVGRNVKLSRRIKVLGARRLVIEDDVAVANSVILDARGTLTLERGALIGFESVLLTFTHAWPDPERPVHLQGSVSAPVLIGANAWVGARVFVLPGATIGRSSVIGANSVVSKNVPPMSVAAGTPAQVVSARVDRSRPQGER
jgi:putative colanic acid biosynthesis acetyltransferase WcaF